MSRTNTCWQIGFSAEQGFGPSENTGASWPFSETGVGEVMVLDAYEQPHQLIFNNADGLWYDISTVDGANTTKMWLDGAAVAGTGGTDIVPSVIFGEDRGNFEHYFIGHKETHIYVRPVKETDGLVSGLQLDLDIFSEGEPTTPTASSDNIPATGDIKYDIRVEGHRLQTKLTANKAKHRISGRQQYYANVNRAASPDNKVMNEDTLQRELNIMSFWASLKFGNLINRVTGSNLITAPTAVSSPDGKTEGISFSSAINLGSVTLVAGTFMMWYKGTIAVTIGGAAVALTTHGTSSDSWILGYATVTASGAIVITPTGLAYAFDIRTFASALSAAARALYFTDVDDYSGNVVLPR